MANQSMTDVAFTLMTEKKNAIPFKMLWEEVKAIMGYSDSVALNKVSVFYANMSLDTRFALCEDGNWDLRSRHTYNETHKDLSDILVDGDEDEINEEYDNEDASENESENEKVFTANSDEEY